MPLPDNEKVVALADALLKQFDGIFGVHPGFRPAHAKGLLLSGTFTPAADATFLTRAPHVKRESTPISLRFSNSSGIPTMPDNNPQANPRGMAVRFHLAERVHTDIVSHATDGFPTRTGEEFLEFLQAAAASEGSKESPTPIQKFVASHPKALAFVQKPKPSPSSFARETYFGVTAMEFINAGGERKFGRYRIMPEAGNDHLSDDAASGKDPEFLFDEIKSRVAVGPVSFRLLVQVAESSDVVDDATEHWPEDRRLVELGRLVLDGISEDNPAQQQHIIFDPIPRVDGIEASPDPLLELRAAVYLLSGRRRRAAE
ncbi:MAG: Catalase related subgroup protein [Bryobacterales bacterium]|jgi:catalase|nr:Catalase related subgroup protein [Bryobacterales bacterium]